MYQTFVQTFSATFFAVLKIFVIIIAAGVLVRKNYITGDILKSMASAVVKIFLPCLIFSNIIQNFYVSELKIWPLLPLSAIALIAFGVGFGVLLFMRQLPAKKNMLSLTSMQNAAYFVLPLGAALFPEQVDKFNLYCFLFMLGISPVMWSLGRYFISGSSGDKFKIKDLITPPLVANLLSMFLVFTGIRTRVPDIVIECTDIMGKAAVPVALFILGGMLGGIKFKFANYIADSVKVVLVKLIALPIVTIIILYFSNLNESYPLLCGFLVLESAVAPSTANLMQVKHYGGNEDELSSITLLCYVASMITLPIWFSVWKMLVTT